MVRLLQINLKTITKFTQDSISLQHADKIHGLLLNKRATVIIIYYSNQTNTLIFSANCSRSLFYFQVKILMEMKLWDTNNVLSPLKQMQFFSEQLIICLIICLTEECQRISQSTVSQHISHYSSWMPVESWSRVVRCWHSEVLKSHEYQLSDSVADPGVGPGRAPPLPYFRPNWGQKGKKNFLETGPPFPLSQGLDDQPPPLNSRSGSSTEIDRLSVTIAFVVCL